MPLSPEEITEAFTFFDTEGNGVLEEEQFTKMVQSLGQTPTKEKLKELYGTHAKEGKIDKAACDAMMPEIEAEKKTKAQVLDAFKVFDNRGDGCITVDNFKQMLGQVGEPLSPPEVQEAVAKALEKAPKDSDGKEAIEYGVYVEWMMGDQA